MDIMHQNAIIIGLLSLIVWKVCEKEILIIGDLLFTIIKWCIFKPIVFVMEKNYPMDHNYNN